MIVAAYFFSGLSFLMGLLFSFRAQNPWGWFTLFPKLFGAVFSPFWAIMGVVGVILGGLYGAVWAIPLGIVGAIIMTWYVYLCSRGHEGFEHAFGADWKNHISPEQVNHMVKRRWSFYLPLKSSSEPIWERDLSFWTIPGTDRDLLCDVWRPGNGRSSGMGIVYLHGGAWFIMDKDFGTRSLFNHLVAQGHTVMDVAYRLCPEVDIFGMIGDVKRAISWMKANAERYSIHPEKLVLGGASAGGHLALLAGYTPHLPDFTPNELNGEDLSVSGIFSYYGPTDMQATYEHENQQLFVGLPPVPIGERLESTNRLNLDPEILRFYAGRLDLLLGGYPQDAADIYKLASPITHVHPGSPPTLLIQGQQDFITPVDATCDLHTKLVESGVPAINVVFPWTDHAFDLLFPQIAPPAQAALHDLDRFLALVVNKN